jgi:ribose transport system permease protein
MIKDEGPEALPEKTVPRLNWTALGLLSNKLLPLVIFIIMYVAFSIFANHFFTVRGVLNLLIQTSTFTILGISATLVLIVGCIDFSPGAVIALSGTALYVFAAMGMPIWIAAIAASILGGVVGLANGFLVAKVRLPSFIITMAMAMVVYGLLTGFGAFMSTHAGPPPHPENLNHIADLASTPIFRIISHDANGAEIVFFPGISWVVIIMVIIAVFSHLFLENTKFGRYAYLIGSNPQTSILSGIKVVRIKILAFVFASMLAGLVGVLLTSRLGIPAGAVAGYEMIAIECAMIGGASLSGGTGNVGRTVIGSFLISTLAMGIAMVKVNQIYLPMLLNGLILIGAVYLDQKRNRK